MCVKCTEHRKHKKYHFDDYLLFEEDVKKYKKEIIDLRTNCENLENQLNSISKENISLRLTDEKYLREIELIRKEKENFANKLTKKKRSIK